VSVQAPAAGLPGQGLGPQDLDPILRKALPDRRFAVVSNREPYEHFWDDAVDAIAVRNAFDAAGKSARYARPRV
jgi:hypothetical protein